MAALHTGPVEPYALPAAEAADARQSCEALAGFAGDDAEPVNLQLTDPATGRVVEVTLSATVLRLLTDALSQMAAGNAVALIPLDAELSTQQAADLLGVSRPFLVKLLDQGQIPHRKVGTQRRVRFEALRRYIDEQHQQAVAAVQAMAAEAQRLGLYK